MTTLERQQIETLIQTWRDKSSGQQRIFTGKARGKLEHLAMGIALQAEDCADELTALLSSLGLTDRETD